ncbi:hypothetical protein V5D56_09830 [Cellulosimicrobium sp. PMB13]|uniref:hypothetical protein n=1 Tax=Cellulosimicrobium sp. PMB13 TaxID=3120158 RepID=UPI003F4BD6C5
MSDEKHTPGERPLHDELFEGDATTPLPTSADDTQVLPPARADDTLTLPSTAPTSTTATSLGEGVPVAGTPPTDDPWSGTAPTRAERPAPGGTAPSAPSAPSVPSVPSASVPDTAARREPSRGPRVATIVWGFVLFALGAAVLAAALGADVDLGLAAIVVLVVAGVTLVVGSVVTSVRRRGQG